MRLLAWMVICGVGATYATIPPTTAAQGPAQILPIVDHKSQNVKFTTEPRPLRLAGGATVHFADVEGPAGAKIELAQR